MKEINSKESIAKFLKECGFETFNGGNGCCELIMLLSNNRL